MKKETNSCLFEPVVQQTADGSYTLYIPSLDEHYHSVNGALQESVHVFIEAGLKQIDTGAIRLFEIGFGTGLNALLTLKELMEDSKIQRIDYFAIELFPLAEETLKSLIDTNFIWPAYVDLFKQLHRAPWNETTRITDRFSLTKIQGDATTTPFPDSLNLIYFDAFSPDKQPELWTQQMFNRVGEATHEGGIVVTYCAKGAVRRGMQEAGFEMKRLPGPPGKRHILQGVKK